jgi:hypothetical protein
VSANGAAYPSLDALAAAPVAAPGAVADLRRFISEQGITVPADADADRRLERLIVRYVAYAKWGDAGVYRITAVLDPDVHAAAAAFARAAAMLK